MATATQVYTIMNSLAKQQYGSTAIAVTDSSSMVALGTKVMSSESDKDAFLKVLTDRIGRTIFSIRRYTDVDQNVVKHPFDFGVILQKIYVAMPETTENSSWQIGEDDFEPEFAPVIKPTVRQKLFESLNTFEIAVTVPDHILKTAFLGAVEMAVFIDAIFMAQENRLTVAMKSMVNITRGAFIARKLQAGKTCGSINLLTNYNTEFGTSLTAAKAIYDQAFLRYASSEISLWCSYMKDMSTLFNDEGYERHTDESDMVVTVLSKFAKVCGSYLQADTFHKELVSLPRYNEVSYWQGSGTGYAFADISKISIKLDEDTTVTQAGIVAVAYDYEALGATINAEFAETQRNPRSQYTDYFHKVERGLFNDMSENGIVFYIADTNYTPPTPVTPPSTTGK